MEIWSIVISNETTGMMMLKRITFLLSLLISTIGFCKETSLIDTLHKRKFKIEFDKAFLYGGIGPNTSFANKSHFGSGSLGAGLEYKNNYFGIELESDVYNVFISGTPDEVNSKTSKILFYGYCLGRNNHFLIPLIGISEDIVMKSAGVQKTSAGFNFGGYQLSPYKTLGFSFGFWAMLNANYIGIGLRPTIQFNEFGTFGMVQITIQLGKTRIYY